MSKSNLTLRKAKAHEALFVRLCALMDQSMAAKRPGAPVSEAAAALAGAVLGEVAWFDSSASASPAPAADWADLLLQLGQARARLEDFEAQNSAWDKDQNARLWLLRYGTAPIRRLRPLSTLSPRPKKDPKASELRKLLETRINAITKGMV
ncbi:hypothetical protein [Devosia sp. CAU 1758]